MRLDKLDVRIIALLQQDARLSFREIAEKVGSTNPTVSARVKGLEDIGFLQGYRAQIDHSVLGGTSYMLQITTQPASAEQVFAALQETQGVSSIHLLAGGRLMAHVYLRPPTYTLTHLHSALASLHGLLTYDANEVIQGHTRPLVEELPENVDVPCHQCKGPIHGDPVKGKVGERAYVFCCRQCLGTFRDRFEKLVAGSKVGGSPELKPAPKTSGANHDHAHHH